MSGTPTFKQLLEVDTGAVGAAAAAWDQLAKELDNRVDDMLTVRKQIPDVWEGVAGDRAVGQVDGLRREAESAYVAVLSIGQALGRHADGAAQLRQHAHDLVAQARKARISLGGDGTFGIDAGYADEHTARSLSIMAHQADELVAAAQRLDQQTARTIAENSATASGTPAARVPRENVPPPGSDPKAVKAWWDSLTAQQRRFVLAEYPELVGGLDGMPVASRDVANRIMLDRESDRLSGRQAELNTREAYIRSMIEAGRGAELYPDSGNPVGSALAELKKIKEEREDNAGKLKGIGVINGRLDDHTPGQQRAYLIGFSAADDGRAIVAVGNPDDAGNVLTYVPGTGSDLSKVRGDLQRVEFMADDAGRLDRTTQTAAIMWLGYDAPDGLGDAARDRYADAGGDDLRRFHDGLRATQHGGASHNVVIGHSYGSTVVGHAAAERLDVNDVIFVGSPGVGVDSATGLHITGDPRHSVWSSTAANDPIQHSGLDDNLIHGENPSGPGFGGRTFTSDPGTAQWNWRDPFSFSMDAHSQYWEQDSASRQNIARITVGRYGEVT